MEKHEQKIKNLVENDLVIEDLPMRRVPKKQLDWFKEYAKEEFANDYGMLQRELIMFYRGMYLETHLNGLQALHDKVDQLLPEQKEQIKQPKKTKRMGDGTERRIE